MIFDSYFTTTALYRDPSTTTPVLIRCAIFPEQRGIFNRFAEGDLVSAGHGVSLFSPSQVLEGGIITIQSFNYIIVSVTKYAAPFFETYYSCECDRLAVGAN